MADQDVLLRLVMKGMDPAEAQRLSRSSLAAVEAELNASMARQAEAHRKAAEAQTAEAKKAAREEIKDAQEKTKGLINAMRAVEAEAKKAAGMSQTHWRRLFEDMENLTVVSQGVAAAVTAIGARMKAAAEEIINVTNVYNSLKGSIKEASEATQGTVTNMELIQARNRALVLDLKLTDQQFADIAQAADSMADSIGGNTKEAMDQLIQGLGTGQVKALKFLETGRDADKVLQEFAKSIGTTSDKLSDQGKRLGIQQAAFAELRKKALEAAADMNKPVNVATALEQAIVGAKNQWTDFVAKVGSFTAPEWFKEFLGGPAYLAKKYYAQIDAGRASIDLVASKYAKKTPAGLPEGVDKKDLIDQEKARKDALAEYNKTHQVGNMDKAIRDAAFASSQERLAGMTALSPEELAIISQETERDLLREQFGEAGSALLRAELSSKSQGMAFDNEADVNAEGDTIDRELLDKKANEIKEAYDKLYEASEGKLKELQSKAGGGFFAEVLFGENGPDGLVNLLDFAQQETARSFGLISDAASGMGDAFGNAFASWAQGEKGFKAAMAEGTRDVVRNLTARATTEAAMHVAYALGDLAFGNFAGAAAHGIAAAKFGAIALTAGAALSALGTNPKDAKGSTPTTPRTPTFSSSGGGRSSSGSSDQAPTIINVSVFPGGEQAAGDAVVKALEARKAQTGRGIDHLMS